MGRGSRDEELTVRFSESVKVTASVDGALFADGTFVGPDTKHFFATLTAERDARKELYTEIVELMKASTKPEAAVDHVQALVNTKLGSTQPPPGKDGNYIFAKRRYAMELFRIGRESGDKGILEFVRAELAKPQVELRKI